MCNVLVTGGSRGIGLAISEKLAGADFVIAVARRESGELRAAIGEATQGNLHFRACDLSAVDGLPAFVKSMRDDSARSMASSTMPASAPRACLRPCTIPTSKRWCASTCCRR
jgi:NAD(P)-dependent dehydrogenase (short-subunit alcohol dehydrogenase family)